MSRSSAADLESLPHMAPTKAKRRSKAKTGAVLLALLCAGFGTGAAITHEETSACHQPPAALSVSNGK